MERKLFLHRWGVGLAAFALAALLTVGAQSVYADPGPPAPSFGVVYQYDASYPTTACSNTGARIKNCGARVGADNALAVNTEGRRTTYRASVIGLVPVASASDIAYIVGSATKTVRITRISVAGSAGTALNTPVVLIKRSTADTGGTCTAATAVPVDSGNAAATAVLSTCTANPTVGTPVGNLAARSTMLNVGTAASVPSDFLFGTDGGQPIVLRGVAQTVGINLNAVSVSSGVINITVEWTEEAGG